MSASDVFFEYVFLSIRGKISIHFAVELLVVVIVLCCDPIDRFCLNFSPAKLERVSDVVPLRVGSRRI